MYSRCVRMKQNYFNKYPQWCKHHFLAVLLGRSTILPPQAPQAWLYSFVPLEGTQLFYGFKEWCRHWLYHHEEKGKERSI